MIKTFSCGDTEKVAHGLAVRRWCNVARQIQRKLAYLNAAKELSDLCSPPGNRLEALWGDRVGQYSIRVNDQYRVCFIWRDGNCYGVEVVDYH